MPKTSKIVEPALNLINQFYHTKKKKARALKIFETKLIYELNLFSIPSNTTQKKKKKKIVIERVRDVELQGEPKR